MLWPAEQSSPTGLECDSTTVEINERNRYLEAPVACVSDAVPVCRHGQERSIFSMTSGWPLRSHLELGAFTTAVPCARLHAALVAREWGAKELAPDVELVVAELAANALRASCGAAGERAGYNRRGQLNLIRLRLASDGRQVLVEVWDSNPQPPAAQRLGPDGIPPLGEQDGRGLFLVSAISARWGYYFPLTEPHRDELFGRTGKVIWAALEAPSF
ncbi:MAG: ATP-binding protein [Streptosporangiaceae bacterium]